MMACTVSAQTEQTSYIIFNEIGLVYNYRHYIHYFAFRAGTQAGIAGDHTTQAAAFHGRALEAVYYRRDLPLY